jgi:uncharacterized protein (DUF111 family)
MPDDARFAYFDCASGASGEMMLGSLISAGLLEADLRDAVAPLQRAGAAFEVRVREVTKGPVSAIEVSLSGQVPNVHARLNDMLALVRAAQLAPAVVTRASAILRRLADEAARHAGQRPADLPFEGTSGIDGVVAAVGVAGSLAALDVREVTASPVNVGAPNPVVTGLLAGAPTYSDASGVPLVTPLGAAAPAELVAEWPASPPFAGGEIGHGAGHRDLPRPNVMRCFLGYGTIAAPPSPLRPE